MNHALYLESVASLAREGAFLVSLSLLHSFEVRGRGEREGREGEKREEERGEREERGEEGKREEREEGGRGKGWINE